ncbi:hypothetical protein [Stenotrophomonas muris]|uniref:hypothetical protein n=1 Tax=Stenotrophomonas muris TaxID=2963283 RepID=UPI0040413267
MIAGAREFAEWFAEFRDQFVVIGGVALVAVMQEAQLQVRATKDLDLVLIVEALTPAFGQRFWEYIEAGGYEVRQRSDGHPTFYRFRRPADGNQAFLREIELFARAPVALPALAEDQRIVPVPLGEEVSSLSAILLDQDYYEFLIAGRREIDGVPLIGEDRLIPLKALAWMRQRDARAAGDHVDTRNIDKHLGDVLDLAVMLVPGQVVPGQVVRLPGRMAQDLSDFMALASEDTMERFNQAARDSRAERLTLVAAAFGIEA